MNFAEPPRSASGAVSPRLAPVLAGVTAATVAAGFVFQISSPPGHDLAWLLVATERLFTDERPVTSFFLDPNPPLILYLLAPAVGLARLLALPLPHATALCLSALTVSSLLLTNRLLAAREGGASATGRGVFLLVAAFALAIFPGLPYAVFSFGQREHLMAILLLPHLAACAQEAGRIPVPPRLGLAAGLLGGLGAAVKPHYGIALAGIELYLAARRRTPRVWLRPQALALVAIACAYGAWLLLAASAYLATNLRLFLDAYWIYQQPLAERMNAIDWVPLLTTLPAALLARRCRWTFELGLLLALAATLFYAASLLQGTGWRYLFLPFQVVTLLAWAMPVAAAAERLTGARAGNERERARPGRLAALGFGLAALGIVASPTFVGTTIREGDTWRRGRAAGSVERMRRGIDDAARGGGVAFISLALGAEFPALLYSDARYCSRLSCLWPVAAVLRARAAREDVPARLTTQRTDEIERIVRDAVVEDFASCRPGAVFVDRRTRTAQHGTLDFDVLEALNADPRFARLWHDYHRSGRLGRFDVYTRRDPG